MGWRTLCHHVGWHLHRLLWRLRAATPTTEARVARHGDTTGGAHRHHGHDSPITTTSAATTAVPHTTVFALWHIVVIIFGGRRCARRCRLATRRSGVRHAQWYYVQVQAAGIHDGAEVQAHTALIWRPQREPLAVVAVDSKHECRRHAGRERGVATVDAEHACHERQGEGHFALITAGILRANGLEA